MDFSCSRLRELLHSGGSSAVIEYLAETIKRHRTDVIVTTLQAEIEKFMRLEQQDLEQCAFEIQELLTSNNISMGVEYEVFNERAKNGRSCHDRKASALETIGKHWGSDVIQQYGWDHHGSRHFLEDLAYIARRKQRWNDAVPFFNRAILDCRNTGSWGMTNHCPERPLKQVHVTRVRKHLATSASHQTKGCRSEDVPESTTLPIPDTTRDCTPVCTGVSRCTSRDSTPGSSTEIDTERDQPRADDTRSDSAKDSDQAKQLGHDEINPNGKPSRSSILDPLRRDEIVRERLRTDHRGLLIANSAPVQYGAMADDQPQVGDIAAQSHTSIRDESSTDMDNFESSATNFCIGAADAEFGTNGHGITSAAESPQQSLAKQTSRTSGMSNLFTCSKSQIDLNINRDDTVSGMQGFQSRDEVPGNHVHNVSRPEVPSQRYEYEESLRELNRKLDGYDEACVRNKEDVIESLQRSTSEFYNRLGTSEKTLQEILQNLQGLEKGLLSQSLSEMKQNQEKDHQLLLRLEEIISANSVAWPERINTIANSLQNQMEVVAARVTSDTTQQVRADLDLMYQTVTQTTERTVFAALLSIEDAANRLSDGLKIRIRQSNEFLIQDLGNRIPQLSAMTKQINNIAAQTTHELRNQLRVDLEVMHQASIQATKQTCLSAQLHVLPLFEHIANELLNGLKKHVTENTETQNENLENKIGRIWTEVPVAVKSLREGFEAEISRLRDCVTSLEVKLQDLQEHLGDQCMAKADLDQPPEKHLSGSTSRREVLHGTGKESDQCANDRHSPSFDEGGAISPKATSSSAVSSIQPGSICQSKAKSKQVGKSSAVSINGAIMKRPRQGRSGTSGNCISSMRDDSLNDWFRYGRNQQCSIDPDICRRLDVHSNNTLLIGQLPGAQCRQTDDSGCSMVGGIVYEQSDSDGSSASRQYMEANPGEPLKGTASGQPPFCPYEKSNPKKRQRNGSDVNGNGDLNGDHPNKRPRQRQQTAADAVVTAVTQAPQKITLLAIYNANLQEIKKRRSEGGRKWRVRKDMLLDRIETQTPSFDEDALICDLVRRSPTVTLDSEAKDNSQPECQDTQESERLLVGPEPSIQAIGTVGSLENLDFLRQRDASDPVQPSAPTKDIRDRLGYEQPPTIRDMGENYDCSSVLGKTANIELNPVAISDRDGRKTDHTIGPRDTIQDQGAENPGVETTFASEESSHKGTAGPDSYLDSLIVEASDSSRVSDLSIPKPGGGPHISYLKYPGTPLTSDSDAGIEEYSEPQSSPIATGEQDRRRYRNSTERSRSNSRPLEKRGEIDIGGDSAVTRLHGGGYIRSGLGDSDTQPSDATHAGTEELLDRTKKHMREREETLQNARTMVLGIAGTRLSNALGHESDPDIGDVTLDFAGTSPLELLNESARLGQTGVSESAQSPKEIDRMTVVEDTLQHPETSFPEKGGGTKRPREDPDVSRSELSKDKRQRLDRHSEVEYMAGTPISTDYESCEARKTSLNAHNSRHVIDTSDSNSYRAMLPDPIIDRVDQYSGRTSKKAVEVRTIQRRKGRLSSSYDHPPGRPEAHHRVAKSGRNGVLVRQKRTATPHGLTQPQADPNRWESVAAHEDPLDYVHRSDGGSKIASSLSPESIGSPIDEGIKYENEPDDFSQTGAILQG